MVMLSVIIPAHNEEALIGKCIDSIQCSAKQAQIDIEIVVCINRCTDNTEHIAKKRGATITHEDAANIAKIRNHAISITKGETIITLDADSTMSKNYINEVIRKMQSGRYLGGASFLLTDKLNLATAIFGLLVLPLSILMRFSGGMFWFNKQAFLDVGGFDESKLTGEDLALANKLKRAAKQQNLSYGFLYRAFIRTSTRKQDEFGAFFMLLHPHWIYYGIKGKNQAFADKYLYNTRRSQKKSPK